MSLSQAHRSEATGRTHTTLNRSQRVISIRRLAEARKENERLRAKAGLEPLEAENQCMRAAIEQQPQLISFGGNHPGGLTGVSW